MMPVVALFEEPNTEQKFAIVRQDSRYVVTTPTEKG